MNKKVFILAIAMSFAGMAYASPTILDWNFRAPSLSDHTKISPNTNGDIVYDTNTSTFWGYAGGWISLSGSSSGNLAQFRSVTTTDAADPSDEVLQLSGASFTETLPTAVGNAGRKITLIHNGTSNSQVYTIATTSGQIIGGGAATTALLYNTGEVLRLVSDGTGWQILGRAKQTSKVITDTPNGYGSTDNKIRRFTNATTTGGAITRASSAGNGDTFTINEDGVYSMSITDTKATSNSYTGISVNSNQLTTSIISITAANRLMVGYMNGDGIPTYTIVRRLQVGDVIRVHGDGGQNGVAAYEGFYIEKIGY